MVLLLPASPPRPPPLGATPSPWRGRWPTASALLCARDPPRQPSCALVGIWTRRVESGRLISRGLHTHVAQEDAFCADGRVTANAHSLMARPDSRQQTATAACSWAGWARHSCAERVDCVLGPGGGDASCSGRWGCQLQAWQAVAPPLLLPRLPAGRHRQDALGTLSTGTRARKTFILVRVKPSWRETEPA